MKTIIVNSKSNIRSISVYQSLVLAFRLLVFVWLGVGRVVAQEKSDSLTLNVYVHTHYQLVSAVMKALQEKPKFLLEGRRFAITSNRYEDDWALVSVSSLDGPQSNMRYVGIGESGCMILANRRADSTWQATIYGTELFIKQLQNVPDDFLSPYAKNILGIDPVQLQAITSTSSVEYKFPWVAGLSLQWWNPPGWHGNPPAIDFGTGGSDKRILAAAGGTVTYICRGSLSVNIRIKDVDGVTLQYFHIDKEKLESNIYEGATVKRGQVLGILKPDTWNDECGWTQQQANNAHLHWVIPSDRKFTADGWEILYPNNYWEKNGQRKEVFDFFQSTNQIGDENDLVLENITISSGQTVTYQASNSITGRNFLIQSGAQVSFQAGNEIILDNGFTAENGCEFIAEIVTGILGSNLSQAQQMISVYKKSHTSDE